MSRTRNKRLPPLHPNEGVRAEYRRRLERLIDEMHASVIYWLRAAYKKAEPATMAQDAGAAIELQTAVRALAAQWKKRFRITSRPLAQHFAKSATERSDKGLESALGQVGMTVSLRMTPAAREVLQATTHANVSLIKSIPEKYLHEVEGLVMRSVQQGRTLDELAKAIQSQYGKTRKRAALIARDQNNKATAAMTRARQNELDLKAIWRHSGGGKHPRPTHVKNDGKAYDPQKGWYDPAVKRYIFPGEEINCRCVSVTVVPGF